MLVLVEESNLPSQSLQQPLKLVPVLGSVWIRNDFPMRPRTSKQLASSVASLGGRGGGSWRKYCTTDGTRWFSGQAGNNSCDMASLINTRQLEAEEGGGLAWQRSSHRPVSGPSSFHTLHFLSQRTSFEMQNNRAKVNTPALPGDGRLILPWHSSVHTSRRFLTHKLVLTDR